MKVYQIGPDMPYDMFDNSDDYVWVVVNYVDHDGYSGSGEIVALRKDGGLDGAQISHCSCNCPLEDFPQRLNYTVEEFLSVPQNIHDDNDFSDELKNKVRELMSL